MPGIEELDNLINFDWVALLDTVISTGPVIFGIIFALFIAEDFWRAFRKKKSQKLSWAIIWTGCVMLQIIIAIMMIMSILYVHDGRYSHHDITAYNSDRVYFGQVNNGKPHGFGKEFEQDKTIHYVGEFVDGDATGHGTLFSRKDDTVFISYTGEYLNNLYEGFGTQYDLIAGEIREVYSGEYHKSKYDGEGHLTIYDEDGSVTTEYEGRFKAGKYNGWGTLTRYKNGVKEYVYTGGWANEKKFGYGTEIEYEPSGNISSAYQGTFWYDKQYADGIWEYYTSDDTLVVWHGYSSEGHRTEDGAYYYSNGEFFPEEQNKSSVFNEEKKDWEDDEEQQKLMEKWPYPSGDTLIAGET